MKMSRLAGRRTKETPAGCQWRSQEFFFRGGYLRGHPSKGFLWLPVGSTLLNRLYGLLKKELAYLNCQYMRVEASVEPPVCHGLHVMNQSSFSENLHSLLEELKGQVYSYRQLPLALGEFTSGKRVYQDGNGWFSPSEYPLLRGLFFSESEKEAMEIYSSLMGVVNTVLRRCHMLPVFGESISALGNRATSVAVRGEFGDLDFAVEEGGSQVTRDAASIYIPQPDETLYPIEEVHTPGQSSIEELCKGLSIEAENTCKLMLLRCTDEEKLIAVLIRGDLDLNVQALSQYYSPGAVFSKATDEELRIAGFEPGYGSMMGVLKDNVSLYVDHSVANGSFVVGANRENYHLKNWNFQRDLNFGEIGRFSLARQGHFHGESRYPWQFFPGLELGRIHQVKKDILQSYGFEYMTKEGKTSVLNCCCLQLDLFRILAASCELNSDKFGPIWSPFLSPFDVHICILDKKQESLTEADLLYEKLSKSGFRVLMDDRIESPGVQFAEADLLGAPVRVIISAKNLKSSKVELAQRGVKDRTLVDKGFAQKAISNLWDEVVCSG